MVPPRKAKSPKTVSKKPKRGKVVPPHFKKEVLPPTLSIPSMTRSSNDSTIFTTIVALLIVAFVVLGGYIYSRQNHRAMRENIGMPLVNRPAIETIDVASTVTLTPEVRDILRILPGILFIESDDRLQGVRMIDDVVSVHAENWDFFKHAIVGDYVLEFKKRTVLYRLPGHQIINLGPAPITPSVAN